MENKNSKKIKKTRRSKIKKANTFLAIIVFVLLAIVLGSLYYVYSTNEKMKQVVELDTIYNNIYINNFNLGDLSIDEAKNMLKTNLLQTLHNKNITFNYEDKNWELSYDTLKADYNIDSMVKSAYDIGRTGTLKERYDIVTALTDKPKKFELEYTFDSSILEGFVIGLEKDINIEMKNSEMQRANGKFTGTPEQIGQKLNTQQAIEAATALIKEQKEEKIALVVEKNLPQYTSEYYNKMNNNIGNFDTVITNPAQGGVSNIKLASSKINDHIIYPGEVFSTNEALGPTTAATGYMPAPVIVNGKLEDGIGGGICQVSTTLYNAVMYAELEIVERQCHSRPVGYVDKGRDATLAGDYLDFKFKNSTQYPIYIESYVQGNNLFVNIYGDEIHSSGRNLKFESVITEILEPPAEKVIDDNTLPAGTRKVVSQPKEGYKVKVYKSIYDGANLLDKSHISTSTYKPARGEVRIGTKKANATKPLETVPKV